MPQDTSPTGQVIALGCEKPAVAQHSMETQLVMIRNPVLAWHRRLRGGTIDEDMRRVVDEQRLGYAATVCPDATPNLSPKGTTAVWDEDHLVFADIRSPRTVENLRHNPVIEINVVDPVSRKGYRFKGTGTVHTEGIPFDEVLAFYRRRGVVNEIRGIVLVG